MAERLRAGILGGGFMAQVHARAIRDSSHDVVALASSSLESGTRAANKLNIATVFGSWQELIASPDIDVVHICTPNVFHAEMAIGAARANKHIVCEKPIAVSYPQAVEMAFEVEKSGVGFAVPFAYRFYPIVRELRSRIQEGQLGTLHLIHGSYLQDWLADPGSTNWRVDSVSSGRSRAFADIGTHWCDLMEFVSGDHITRLMANTSRAYESRGRRAVGTEDIATIMFETERGAAGTLTVSQVSVGRKNQLLIELSGPGASFAFNQERPDSLLIGGIASNQIVTSGQETLHSEDARRLSQVPSGHPQGYQDAFNSFVADAYSGFLGNVRPGVPGLADGLRSSVLVDAVLQSAETGTWMNVATLETLKLN